jgi:hypothetical protein
MRRSGAALFAILALAACRHAPEPRETPEQVVERFLQAGMSHDRFVAITCAAQGEPRPDGSKTDKRERAIAPLLVATIFEQAKGGRLQVVEGQRDGEKAVVTYEVRPYEGGLISRHRARLEARGDTWKIVLLK